MLLKIFIMNIRFNNRKQKYVEEYFRPCDGENGTKILLILI